MFKKLLLFLALTVLITSFATLSFAYESDWYIYNGASTAHTYSVRFPPDWEVTIISDELQVFSPQSLPGDYLFFVNEFEGQTYEQVIDYYKGSSSRIFSLEDQIFVSQGEDLVGTTVTYSNQDNTAKRSISLIKRGSVIIALGNANIEEDFPAPAEFNDTIQAIHDSFAFTDSWNQYIDFQDKYSFIFPSNLDLTNLNNGVEIANPSHLGGTLFTVLRYSNTTVSDAAELAEGYSEELSDQENISFHGLDNAILATYYDRDAKSNLSRIFISSNGNSFSLTNVNIEDNFPHLNYYDQYLIEMLESFEFFEMDTGYSPYLFFPDVRDDHNNAEAINALKSAGVIDGYPNGTFGPDGEINRAELTKLIVASKKTPDAEIYKDCFPDVKQQWFAPYVCYAKEKGWVVGYANGNFNPEANINRVEAIKIILEVSFSGQIPAENIKDSTVSDVDFNEWYGKYFIYADNHKLLDKQHISTEGSGYKYYPGENMTRKEVSESIYRSIQLL